MRLGWNPLICGGRNERWYCHGSYFGSDGCLSVREGVATVAVLPFPFLAVSFWTGVTLFSELLETSPLSLHLHV